MATPTPALRHPGIDQLKAWVTLLVVFHHTAITYGGPGGWEPAEHREGDAQPEHPVPQPARGSDFTETLLWIWRTGRFFPARCGSPPRCSR